MLSTKVVQSINKRLSTGDVAAALAPLEKAVDVRWNELPKLEKKTLTALAKHLREGEVPAEQIADAMFHPNISVRRFVRKLVQVLKADAAPLTKPLRMWLERYLRETVISTTATTDRREIARREEQFAVLQDAVDALRRCDLDEFMDCLRGLSEYWGSLRAEQERQRHEDHERSLEEFEKHQEVWLRRQEEIFQERFGHLGMTLEALREVPRLYLELTEAVANDPEVAALNAAWEQEQDVAPKTLMEEINAASNAFFNVLENLLGRSAKPSAEQEKLRGVLWRWIEDALRSDDPTAAARVTGFHYGHWANWLGQEAVMERAMPLLTEAKAAGRAGNAAWNGLLHAMQHHAFMHMTWKEGKNFAPLPPSITPAAVRALKWGDARDDDMLATLAESIENWLKEHGQAVTVDVEQREEEHAASPYAGMYADAAQYRTVEERVEALCGPPVDEKTLENAVMPQRPDFRSGWIYLWQEKPDWESQVAALREAALPRLFEKLRALCPLYVTALKGDAPLPVQLSEEVAALMTERERQEWLDTKRQQQQSNIAYELRDICDSITLLGGVAVYSQFLDALEVKGLEDFQDEKINELLGQVAHSDELSPAMLPFIRDAHARWERNHQQRQKQRVRVEDWVRRSHYTIYVHALYKIGTPKTVAEAWKIVETIDAGEETWAWHPLPRLARERRDYDMLLPLLRNRLYKDDDLLALWDDLRENQPRRVPDVVNALMTTLAEATEANRALMPLAMLERVEKQTDLFTSHFDTLTQCIESPLPNVIRFALAQLQKMPDVDADWTTLCERAGEKLWSEVAGLAKDAAKFLGEVGAKNEDAASVAFAALRDALSLNSVPLLEVILRALIMICGKQEVKLNRATRKRIEQLRDEQPSRLGKLCERVLRKT